MIPGIIGQGRNGQRKKNGLKKIEPRKKRSRKRGQGKKKNEIDEDESEMVHKWMDHQASFGPLCFCTKNAFSSYQKMNKFFVENYN